MLSVVAPMHWISPRASAGFSMEGYDRVFGARPLRRVITSRIEDQVLGNRRCRDRVHHLDVEMAGLHGLDAQAS